MLVCEGGASTGTISAGCLESDVIEHAKRVIRMGAPKIVEYNTASTSDEMVWGLGLGCNGIVRVLVEPLASDSLYLDTLRRCCDPNAAPVLVATLINEDGNVRREKLSGPLAAEVENEVRALSHVEVNSGVTVFIETLMPPVPVVIFGAGHDALAVVELARGLGWQTEVVDPQARPASLERFAIADKVTLLRPEHVADKVAITPRTLTLLMTHNYSHDVALLSFLLRSAAPYIGVMGPRARTERMLSELAADEADLSRLYSPAGLDIGANAPAEVALSIIAEMRAVLEGRRGGMLRERRGSIHGSTGHVERLPLREEQARTMAVA